MNILMVSPFDLVVNRLWGPTVRLHSLAKELIGRGHRVILAGPPPLIGERPRDLDGVPMRYVRAPFHRYPYPKESAELRRDNRRFRLPLVLASRIVELTLLVRREKIDVIYVNRAFMDTAYPSFLAHLATGVPIVCDWDDLEGLHGFSSSFRLPLLLQLFETTNEVLFPRLAGATVVASRFLREFAAQIRVPADRLYFAPSVADTERFHPSTNGSEVRERYALDGFKVLLYCGNLMKGNGVGVESILHTLKLLLEKDPTFRLLVVGEGDLLEKDEKKGELPLIAESLGIEKEVVFTGGVPAHEVPRYIAAADMCLALFPVNIITMSKSPLKVYEYMACGKPVAARSVGEIAHCVEDGVNGVLMHSDDPVEYCDKILACFASPARLVAMGTAARATIDSSFNWARSADSILEACARALSRKDSLFKRGSKPKC